MSLAFVILVSLSVEKQVTCSCLQNEVTFMGGLPYSSKPVTPILQTRSIINPNLQWVG